MQPTKGESLLPIALDVLRYWEDDEVSLDDLLDELKLQFEPRIVAGVNAIMMSLFRHRCKIEKMIRSFGGTFKGRYFRFLEVTVAQMRFCNGIPAEAVANMAITYAKRKFGQATGNWMNAVLRHVNALNFEDFSDEYPAAFAVSRQYLPKETQYELLKIELTPPPFTFRKSALHLDIEPTLGAPIDLDFLPKLFFYTSASPHAIIESESLKNGDLYIQDPSTAFCISLLIQHKIKPETILDACAAPGGKTLLCAALLAPKSIVAFDRSERRQRRTYENIELRKALFENTTITVSSEHLDNKLFFDLVLLDVPCSNSGVIRHRPDAMYRYSPEQLASLQKLQLEILNQHSPRVNKDGYLLYSSCSISEEENLQTLKHFTQAHPEFTVIEFATLFPTLQHDGAFAALLIKN